MISTATEPWKKWVSLVEGFAYRENLVVEKEPITERVDIYNREKSWRVTVLALMNKEFSVNAYFNYDIENHNMTVIKFEHIIFSMLKDVIKAQTLNVKKYSTKPKKEK